jgi:fructokinase
MPAIASIGEILFDIYDGEKKLGGAPFNFIYHVIKLTGKGGFVSKIGDDELGREIISFLKENNISHKHLQIDKKHPTGKAVANLDENKIPHWVIEENTAYDFIEQTEELNELVNNSDCVYYGTLAQRNSQSRKTIQSLFGRNVRYFCDLNIRQNFFSNSILESALSGADVLKLNEDELKLVCESFLKSQYDFERSSQEILSEFNIDLLCVTCGGQGSGLFKKGQYDFYSVEIDNVVDTVGAGDAFAAMLCIGYLRGWNLEKLNRFAAEFAAEIVKVKGALPGDDGIYKNFKEKMRNAG